MFSLFAEALRGDNLIITGVTSAWTNAVDGNYKAHEHLIQPETFVRFVVEMKT